MIISSSRRTDLPAYFPEWTINKILELCNCKQQSIIPPDTPQHGVVFWTKNPKPIMQYLPILDKNNIVYYFQYTINNYPYEEPNIPSLPDKILSYIKLGTTIGFDKIRVRIDPILKSNVTTLQQSLDNAINITNMLDPLTKNVTISFVDYYNKLPSNIYTLTQKEIDYSIKYLTSHIHPSFQILSCAENVHHSRIQPSSCIDAQMFANMGMKLPDITQKDSTQRLLCKCYPSVDIGEYHTCKGGCLYCYAK